MQSTLRFFPLDEAIVSTRAKKATRKRSKQKAAETGTCPPHVCDRVDFLLCRLRRERRATIAADEEKILGVPNCDIQPTNTRMQAKANQLSRVIRFSFKNFDDGPFLVLFNDLMYIFAYS